MVDANIYATLSQWLAEAMRKDFETRFKSDKYTLQKGGAFHKKFSPRFESLLIDLVKEAVCRGKERNILCGEDSTTLYVWKGDGWEEIKDRGFLSELIERTLRILEVGLMYQQNSSPRIARSCMETLQSSEEYLYKPNRPLGEEVLRAIEQMQNERNSMRLWWFSGECPWRKSKGDEKAEWVYLSEIYRKYTLWCKDYNEREFYSNDLGRMISSLGFSKDEGNKRSMSKGTQYLVARKDSDN